MKILFIATVTEHINAFHIPYLKWFKEQGWEVHIATHGNGEILYCDNKHNISIERSPFSLGNLKAYFELKSILKEEKFDIIHGHTPMGGMLARLCGKSYRKRQISDDTSGIGDAIDTNIDSDTTRQFGTRVIYTAHGFHFYKGAPLINWLIYYPVEKVLSKYTDDLITINHEDFAFAKKKMNAKNIHYVPGVGVDTKKFSAISSEAHAEILKSEKRKELNIPESAIVLISVGELNKNKNHNVVLEVLAQLKSEYHNHESNTFNKSHVHSDSYVDNDNIDHKNHINEATANPDNLYYFICGSGLLQESLKSLAESLQLQTNVLFLGQRADVAELLNMSDIFVFPSLREGLSVSLMEAMASGLPCIASNIRGNVDLIENEKGGLLCNAGTSSKASTSNTTLEYAEAIKTLMANESLRNSMGAHNKEVIQKFDIEVVMKQMQKIYLQVR